MTSKNSPLRVIDQKTVNKTPPPGAQPVKYNPYTGGIIRQSTEPRYKIFLQPSSNWIKYPLSLYRENERRYGTIQFAVRIPKLVLRMQNPNADIQKLRIFLSFDSNIFDNYGDDEYNTNVDPLPNIVEFSTNMVTHVGVNNRGVGNLNITPHIGRLIRKYSFYDLLLATGTDIDIDTYRSKSDAELQDIFEDSMYNLRVYAQAMFQPLEPDDEGTEAPYLFRMPVSCSYTLSPDQLKGADISDFSVSFANDVFSVSFSQTSIDSVEYAIYDNSVVSSFTKSNRVYSGKLNSFPSKLVKLDLPVSSFSNRFSQFNSYTAPLTSTSSTLKLNSKYTFVITSTRSLAGVIYSGDSITRNYLIDTNYVINIPNYSDSVFTERNYVLNLVEGRREYTFRKNNLAPVGGILLIYKIRVSGAIRYVPRFFPTSSLNETVSSGSLWYFINDPFTQAGLGKTFNINFNDIVSVDFRPVSVIGRISSRAYTYNYTKLKLTQRLETIPNTVKVKLFDGHYATRFTRSNSYLLAKDRNPSNGYMSANGRFQLTAAFKVVVEKRTAANVYTDITPSSIKYSVFKLSMINTPTAIQLALTFINSSTGLSFIDTGVKFVKGARYRIKFVPIIPNKFSGQYTAGDFIYFLEFNA